MAAKPREARLPGGAQAEPLNGSQKQRGQPPFKRCKSGRLRLILVGGGIHLTLFLTAASRRLRTANVGFGAINARLLMGNILIAPRATMAMASRAGLFPRFPLTTREKVAVEKI